jgi:hypothetical protein
MTLTGIPGQAAGASQLIAPAPSAELSSGDNYDGAGRVLTAAAELRVVNVEAQPGQDLVHKALNKPALRVRIR